MKKIIFLQPAYAHYREKLFDILSKRHGIYFLFEYSQTAYPSEIKQKNNIVFSDIEKEFKIKSLGLIHYFLKEKPEVIISSISTWYFTTLSFIYAKVFRKKIILWIEEWKKPTYSGFRLKNIFRKLIDKIGLIVILYSDALVVSGTAAEKYALSLGRKHEEVFFSLQCSDDLREQQEYIREKRDGYAFLYLSRIIPGKGLDLLIRAFSQLEKERNDVFLYVAGDGPFKEYCATLSKALQINNIKFIGVVPPSDMQEAFRKADVFVLPSYFFIDSYECWGLIVNEAMSMELPIITTTAVGAAYDLVYNGENGFIVQDNNVMELYSAMKKILNLDLRKMGLCSRKIFEEKNDFVKMADGFTNAINYVTQIKKR